MINIKDLISNTLIKIVNNNLSISIDTANNLHHLQMPFTIQAIVQILAPINTIPIKGKR